MVCVIIALSWKFIEDLFSYTWLHQPHNGTLTEKHVLKKAILTNGLGPLGYLFKECINVVNLRKNYRSCSYLKGFICAEDATSSWQLLAVVITLNSRSLQLSRSQSRSSNQPRHKHTSTHRTATVMSKWSQSGVAMTTWQWTMSLFNPAWLPGRKVSSWMSHSMASLGTYAEFDENRSAAAKLPDASKIDL